MVSSLSAVSWSPPTSGVTVSHLKVPIEATYEDESADLELEGKAAQDKIMTLLDGLSIKTATNEQIKEHITKKLAVNEQVKQFEFEANFTDKTEIEFVLK